LTHGAVPLPVLEKLVDHWLAKEALQKPKEGFLKQE